MIEAGGSSSVVERQLPKLNVAGSIPVSRSNSCSGRVWRSFWRGLVDLRKRTGDRAGREAMGPFCGAFLLVRSSPSGGLFALGGAMQLRTKEGSSRTDTIAFGLLVIAVLTAMTAFGLGRNDPSVRTAVLLCVTNLVTALTSIAATLLVGKPSLTHEVETKDGSRVRTAESQTTSVRPLQADEKGTGV